MYKISELIGKQAISLSDAAKQGTVCNVYFDNMLTRCRYFTLVSDEEEEKKWVDYKNLSAFLSDAAVIKDPSAIVSGPQGETALSPINLPAFNQDGKALGTIRDLCMNDNRVVKFITDCAEIAAGTLLSRSEEALVFNDTGAPLKVKKPAVKASPEKDNSVNAKAAHGKPSESKNGQKPAASGQESHSVRAQNTEGSQSVSAQNTGDTQNMEGSRNTNAAPEPQNQTRGRVYNSMERFTAFINGEQHGEKEVKTPSKIPQDKTAVYRSPAEEAGRANKYSFLLGKRLQRNIFNADGAVIIRENELIKEETILKAKENGKLVMLALHSL